MSDYRIDIKVRNNNILKMLNQKGYETVGEFCRLNGLMSQVSTIGEFVNLKRSPFNSRGEFYKIIETMCDLLECTPEDLFTETQLQTCLETNRRTLEVNEAEMKFMLENMSEQKLLEDIVSDEEKPEAIKNALETLTPREQKVLSLRFGLGCDCHTLEDIAKVLDTGRERIRQIEAKALRKLRHPTRSENLKEYYR